MSSNFPHFIQDNLIHSSNLQISRKQLLSLVLLRNLQFFEIDNCQVLGSIDLQNTILNKIQHKLESLEPEFNQGPSQSNVSLGSSIAYTSQVEGSILIGKYVYQNLSEKTLYILLKCWDVMVVIKKDSENLILQAEYDDVRSFKMCKTSDFQVKLCISFLHNTNDEITDFQESQPKPVDLPNAEHYKKLLDRIKMKKSELLLHQNITRKEFVKMKGNELFGCNLLRTPRFEEMQILSKCGNAWVKVTPDDDVVVGVPLVNNCSTRLTILRNFRALLYGLGNSDQTFKLYELTTSFSQMENIQNLFQISGQDSENENENNKNNCMWKESRDMTIRPEAFCVLIIKLKISEHFFDKEMTNVPVFAFYDVVKSNKTFNQKCCLTSITFRDIFTDKSCRLNFTEQHLQRDLLTVMASSYKTKARLEYAVTGTSFENYCCKKLDFIKISNNKNNSEVMNVDGDDEDIISSANDRLMLYNKSRDSVWHGTLLEITHINDSTCDVRLFTKSKEKSDVFFSLLRKNLRAVCGIKEVILNAKTLSNKLKEFEAALRDECSSYLEICSSSAMKIDVTDISKKKDLLEQLYLNELKTDLIFDSLQS